MRQEAVLVTGASTGIGKACVFRLARTGRMVFAGVRKKEDADRLVRECPEEIYPIILDITKEDSLREAVGRIRGSIHDRVFSLINNAGISIRGPFEFLPLALVREQLEVNLIGPVAVTQQFLPTIRNSRGRIVFVSSASGRFASPFLGAYSASKAGLEIMSDALRMELAKSGICVSVAVCGSIRTPIWNKATLRAQEIARDLPEEAVALYGSQYRSSNDFYDNIGEKGLPAEKVAGSIVHILSSKRPRPYYLIGRDARLYSLLLKLTPASFRARLVLRVSRSFD